VDATTYRVDNESPLRLSKELVPPDGKFTHRCQEADLIIARMSQGFEFPERGLQRTFAPEIGRRGG
jgi:hypothetical protein